MEKQFIVLYTHQKLKKAKTWHDGTLRHPGGGTKAVLHDEKGCRLDSIHIKLDDIKLGEQLESDRYYILVEEVKGDDTKHAATSSGQAEKVPAPQTSQVTFSRARCAGLKRKKSGFMPPRMIKQPCQENYQSLNSEIERCTAFSDSAEQKFHSGVEPSVRFPLSLQSTQSVKDPYMKFENKSLNSDLSCHRFENTEKNLFNLYSRYDKQRDGSESQSSSQDSYTCKENKKILSPWSVYGSKTSSPSLNGSHSRQQLSESPQFEVALNVSLDKQTLRNSGKYLSGDSDFDKSPEGNTIQLDKLDNSKTASYITSVENESSLDSGKNLSTCRISFKTPSEFKDKTNHANEKNKRNISQIMNLLRKKQKQDCTEENNFKRISFSKGGCKKWQHGSSITRRSEGEINIPTEESEINVPKEELVYVDKVKQIESFTFKAETHVNESATKEIEYVVDKKRLDEEFLVTAQKKCNTDITARLGKEKDSTEQALVKEENTLLEECEESSVDEELIGRFNLNFSPLSHVTESEEESIIDNSEGKGETSEYNRDGKSDEKLSEENGTSYCNGKRITCKIEFNENGSPIHSQKLNTEDCTTTEFTSNSSDKSLSRDILVNNLKHLDSIQGKLKTSQKDFYLSDEKQTDEELNCSSKVDVLHEIELEFVENMKGTVSHSSSSHDSVLESSKRLTASNKGDHDKAFDNNKSESVLDTITQQNCDKNVDPDSVRDTDYVGTETCDVDLKTIAIFDDENDAYSNTIQSDETKISAKDVDKKIAENNESQYSRTTTSQDTLEFSCNTLESENQNYFGIENCQLDNLVQSSSNSEKTADNHVEVETYNLRVENNSSRYFECQNTNMSNKNLGNRDILHEMKTEDSTLADESDHSCLDAAEDLKESTEAARLLNKGTSLGLEDSEMEDPVGNLNGNLRTVDSQSNKLLLKQMRRKAQQNRTTCTLGSYGTQGISSAIVSRVKHYSVDNRTTASPCNIKYRNSAGSPMVTSSTAFDSVGNQWQSPYQQLSASDFSAQSSPSFYIDWENNKPRILNTDKRVESSSVVSGEFNNPDPNSEMNRPSSQNTDDEEIYSKLYRPRLMYQKEFLQKEFEGRNSASCQTSDSQCPAEWPERQKFSKRYVESRNEDQENGKPDNFTNSQDSSDYLDYHLSLTASNRDPRSNGRQVVLTDHVPFISNTQPSEECSLYIKAKCTISHYADESVCSNLAEETGNLSPTSDKLKKSRWQSYMASQASDDCDIDMDNLSKQFESTDKSKKEFIVLEKSPGLYNTHTVLYKNVYNENVSEQFLKPLEDGLDSLQVDGFSELGASGGNAEGSLNEKSFDSKSKEICLITDFDNVSNTKEDAPFLDQNSADKVVLNEKPFNNPFSDTLSSADSLEQLLADDNFDEVTEENMLDKTSVTVGSEQQVPDIEASNNEERKLQEKNNDSSYIRSITSQENGDNKPRELAKGAFGLDAKDNFINVDVGLYITKSQAETNIDEHEAVVPLNDEYDFKNDLVGVRSNNVVGFDRCVGNAKCTAEFNNLKQIESGQEISQTEDAIISILQQNETVSGEMTIEKENITQTVKNQSKFSLDDSLDLSLSLDSDSVCLTESDQSSRKAASLRIGWRPPVKSGDKVNCKQFVSSTPASSQQNGSNISGKIKPTFKCLRLLTKSKTRVPVNSESKVITDREIDNKSKVTSPAVADSQHNLENHQKWNFKSLKQVPNHAGKENENREDYSPVLDPGSQIGAEKYKDTDLNGKKIMDGKFPNNVANRKFKPPSLTRGPVVNRTVSSPSFTQRFPVERKVPYKEGSSVSRTELRFPSKLETEGMQNVLRNVVIPETFQSAAAYKQVLTAALTEYMNTQLFDVAKRYHHALSKVDTTGYSEYKSRNSRSIVNNPNPQCQCGVPSKMICVKKEGPNCGRYFYACSADRKQQCKFFQWADETRRGSVTSGSRRKIQDVQSLNLYMKDQRVHFYGECQLIKRTKENINKYFKAPKWARNRGERDMVPKKQIFLKLPYKGHSSVYAKDDIWVISKHVNFDPLQTFLARSTYYGPSSSLEVEIEPLSGYSPSNWKNEEVCHTILAGNMSSELSCIDNVREHIQTQTPPVLPYLLNRHCGERGRFDNHSTGFQAPRVLVGDQSSRHVHIHSEQMDDLSRQYIEKYRLNSDQAEALRRVANMFSIEKSSIVDSILLIHGVFGAGKSYLLSVMVLFLVEVFQLNDSQSPGQPFPWKLLISSTTNVAVDRILIGLLELGFEDFVRVGSVKKIAKPVLPFSVHASGTDSQELKDLQEMLRSGELTATEKSQVRQSIEKHRLGENKKKLGRVRVVGATCAACSLICLNNMEFPLVLLDECSQMTEPASLLPVAKFACQKLLLVGDPKQLDPTVQGAEAGHQCGLEQTMFDRLIKMGSMPTLLRTQYRCHPYISGVANKLFYGGMLEDGVSEQDRKPLSEMLPTLCFYDVERGEECCEGIGSYYNEKEAQFVVFLIQVVLSSGIEPCAIGVITLYKSQMSRISDLLTGHGDSIDMKGIQVSTVDAFQGGERDVIILSTVRAQACGFIDNDKRTNVALTRARHHLLIVGNLNNLSRNTLWAKVISHCKCYKNGIQSADEARHNLEKYLESLEKCESNHTNEKSKPVSSQNSSASEKIARKPKRKRKLSSSEINSDECEGKASVQKDSCSMKASLKRTRKCSRVDDEVNEEMLDDKCIVNDIERDHMVLETSDRGSVNSEPLSLSSGTQGDDQLYEENEDKCQPDLQLRKRPKHVTKLSSLVFDSDPESFEEEDLPAFTCD